MGKEKQYFCRVCGAPLDLFITRYLRYPVDEETGEPDEEPLEENIPGESEYAEYQCSEDPDHDCGIKYEA